MKPVQIYAASLVALIYATTVIQADQMRRQSSGAAMVPAEVSVKIAGEPYEAKGQASCTHEPKASIYDVAAAMWTVRQESGDRSIQLTLWKPANGSPSMFSLAANGKKNVTVNTVRGSQVVGSGTVTLASSAKGGTFTIDAKTKAGEPVTGTIRCDAFTPAIAEGGN
jgi:hypothetical protein